eukprot:Nk52_evm33s2568 gene=Nk52_evmTU33s2568
MCGILFVLRHCKDLQYWGEETTTVNAHHEDIETPRMRCSDKRIDEDLIRNLKDRIARRGPDISSEKVVVAGMGTDPSKRSGGSSLLWEMVFAGSVLHLRGEEMNAQPFCDLQKQHVFLWNGEIFGTFVDWDAKQDNCFYKKIEVADSENDGSELFHKHLLSAVYDSSSDTEDSVQLYTQRVLGVFSSIKGPWGFTFWDAGHERVWFGRDYFGRRSLVVHYPTEEAGCCCGASFAVCSVGPGTVSDVNGEEEKGGVENKLCPGWQELPADGLYCLCFDTGSMDGSDKWGEEVIRWDNVWILRYVWSETGPLRCPIVNMNMNQVEEYLGDEVVPFEEGNKMPLWYEWSLIEKDAVHEGVAELPCYEQLLYHLGRAVHRRVRGVPEMNVNQKTEYTLSKAKIGILFSGGIDSLIIAVLCHWYLPVEQPVDLFNVGFSRQEDHSSYDVPDRVTGRLGYETLKEVICPQKYPHGGKPREWNFISVNIHLSLLDSKKDFLRGLISPLETILDFSIGSAIWFASRGFGMCTLTGTGDVTVESSADERAYAQEKIESNSRVLLVGMGADEQLAGYGRHRTKYRNYGIEGLIEEVAMDVGRISQRNLGRDDRIISDNGKEARFPFLDEDLVNFLQQLPVCYKANLNLERGYGEKKLLRDAARALGIVKELVELPKRAIQFGSRIAKLDANTKKAKGHHICN